MDEAVGVVRASLSPGVRVNAELDAWLEDALEIRYRHDMAAHEAYVAFLSWESCIGAAVSIGEKLGMDEAAVMARYDALRRAQG